jgi:transcriptional regulator with XRE-family HTH domain
LITRDKLAIDIGKRIKEIREKKGISLKQFELYENGIARGRMSEFENGSRLPSILNLYRIAEVLGAKISDIIKDH